MRMIMRMISKIIWFSLLTFADSAKLTRKNSITALRSIGRLKGTLDILNIYLLMSS